MFSKLVLALTLRYALGSECSGNSCQATGGALMQVRSKGTTRKGGSSWEETGGGSGYVACDWMTEETCWDENWTTTVGCANITTGGCPCTAGQIKCGGDEYYAGWCQHGPCPLQCNWTTEELCRDDSSLYLFAETCAPLSAGGCPCPAGQVKCGAHNEYAGWCQIGPCPLECDWETEFTCYDENWTAASCAMKSTGGCPCPVGGQVRCGSDEQYEGWCYDAPCPLQCDRKTEETCYDDAWTAVSCASSSAGGCPCSDGQVKCGAVDEGEWGYYAGWCHDDTCPLQCDWTTEETCYDDAWTAVSCARWGEGGCPCSAGQVKCGVTDDYSGWCHDDPCPLQCDWKTEETCYDDAWTAVSCASSSAGGCPCSDGQVKCGAGQYDWGYYAGWCQAGPCPLQCDWKTEETCYDDAWTAVSCASSSAGGCPCSAGQVKCGAGQYDWGYYAGWCQSQSEPCSTMTLAQQRVTTSGRTSQKNWAALVLTVHGQYHVFDPSEGMPEEHAGQMRKELRTRAFFQHADLQPVHNNVQLHKGPLKYTLASFLAKRTHEAIEFAGIVGNLDSSAAKVLKLLRPHLHVGTVLQFHELLLPEEKKHLNELLVEQHKAGLHLASMKQDLTKQDLLFRIASISK